MSLLLALLLPSILALLGILYCTPFHIRTHNVVIMSMLFWFAILNVVHIVNSIAWSNNTDIKAKAWMDFSAVVNVGYNYGTPLAHLLLARQLESITSLRPQSALFNEDKRKREKMIDLGIIFTLPTLAILLHLTVMDRRVYVVEDFGPMPSTYWDAWGVTLMAVGPIVIAVTAGLLSILMLRNIRQRRKNLHAVCSAESGVNDSHFWRLTSLTIFMYATCVVRAFCNIVSYGAGVQPLGHRGAPFHNLEMIEQVAYSQLTKGNLKVLYLQWYSVIACSAVFFFCFATTSQTTSIYMDLVRKLMPASKSQNRLFSTQSSITVTKSRSRFESNDTDKYDLKDMLHDGSNSPHDHRRNQHTATEISQQEAEVQFESHDLMNATPTMAATPVVDFSRSHIGRESDKSRV